MVPVVMVLLAAVCRRAAYRDPAAPVSGRGWVCATAVLSWYTDIDSSLCDALRGSDRHLAGGNVGHAAPARGRVDLLYRQHSACQD
jgi:hypothetical protein